MNTGAIHAALCAASAILLLLLLALCYQRRRPLQSMLPFFPFARTESAAAHRVVTRPIDEKGESESNNTTNPLPMLMQSMSDKQKDQLRQVLQLQQQQCALQQLQLLQVDEQATKNTTTTQSESAPAAAVAPTSFSLTAADAPRRGSVEVQTCHTPHSFVSSMHTAPFESKHSPPSMICSAPSQNPLPHNPRTARLTPPAPPGQRAGGQTQLQIPVVG